LIGSSFKPFWIGLRPIVFNNRDAATARRFIWLRQKIIHHDDTTITTFSRFARFEHDACVVWCGAKRRDRRRGE